MYQCNINNTSEKSKRTDFGCKFPNQVGLYSKIKFPKSTYIFYFGYRSIIMKRKIYDTEKILALTITSMSTFSLEIK